MLPSLMVVLLVLLLVFPGIIAAYRYRGATAMGKSKKAYAIKLRDEAGNSVDRSFFGLRNDNNWILDAMAIDRIRMRNRVNFDTWNAMSRTPYDTKYDGRNGTLGFFVEVFVNGEYHGLYCMTDKVNRKLLGVDKAKEDADGKPIINGVMYKCAEWATPLTSRAITCGRT